MLYWNEIMTYLNSITICIFHHKRAQQNPLSHLVITEPTRQSPLINPPAICCSVSASGPCYNQLTGYSVALGHSAWVSDVPEKTAPWVTDCLLARLAGWLTCGLSGQIIFPIGGKHTLQRFTLGKPSKCVCVGASVVHGCVGVCVCCLGRMNADIVW